MRRSVAGPPVWPSLGIGGSSAPMLLTLNATVVTVELVLCNVLGACGEASLRIAMGNVTGGDFALQRPGASLLTVLPRVPPMVQTPWPSGRTPSSGLRRSLRPFRDRRPRRSRSSFRATSSRRPSATPQRAPVPGGSALQLDATGSLDRNLPRDHAGGVCRPALPVVVCAGGPAPRQRAPRRKGPSPRSAASPPDWPRWRRLAGLAAGPLHDEDARYFDAFQKLARQGFVRVQDACTWSVDEPAERLAQIVLTPVHAAVSGGGLASLRAAGQQRCAIPCGVAFVVVVVVVVYSPPRPGLFLVATEAGTTLRPSFQLLATPPPVRVPPLGAHLAHLRHAAKLRDVESGERRAANGVPGGALLRTAAVCSADGSIVVIMLVIMITSFSFGPRPLSR
eukprot:gene10259-7284_t